LSSINWEGYKSQLNEMLGKTFSSGLTTDIIYYTYQWGNPKYVEDYIPKQVIFNNRTTIVIWKDDSKTIVKAADGEPFVEEIGLAEAVVKKLYGNRSQFLRLVEGAYRQPEPKKK